MPNTQQLALAATDIEPAYLLRVYAPRPVEIPQDMDLAFGEETTLGSKPFP
jgi:hypothetical protein